MKQLLLSLIAGIIVTFSSCTINEWESEETFTFSVKEADAFTRGTPIMTSSDMPNIGVYAYYTGNGASKNWAAVGSTSSPNLMNGVTVNNTGVGTGTASWVSSTPEYWPAASDGNTSFFAYSPVATSDNGIVITTTLGTPNLTYTVPLDVTKQPDLMVAVPHYDLNRSSGSNITFRMKHALTCVGFSVAGAGKNIKAVKISGVYMKGNLSMDGAQVKWSGLSDRNSQAILAGINETVASETHTSLMQGDGYLMMIPQSLDDSAQLIIVYDDDKEVIIPLKPTGSWIAGKKINYNISLTDGKVSVTIAPDKLTIPASGTSSLASDSISVACSYSNGNNASAFGWTLSSSVSWLKLSLSANDAANAQSEISGTGNKTVYLYASENSDDSKRIAFISYNGENVAEITQKDYSYPFNVGSDDILFFASDGTLQVGKFKDPNGPLGQGGVAYFKYGSVIGLKRGGWASYSNNVGFDPSSLTISNYKSIPTYSNVDFQQFTTAAANSKWRFYLSGPGYHNAANIALGKGDPCKLAGLSIEQIKAGKIDNGEWRMPTQDEQRVMISTARLGTEYISGFAYWGIFLAPNPGFIAARGHINTSGTAMGAESTDLYLWSSIPIGVTNGPGCGLAGSLLPEYNFPLENGFTIRCVRQ